MSRTPSTTTIAVVGADASEASREVAAVASNVAAEFLDEREGIFDGWRRALRHHAVYTLVDADPIAGVVDQWANRLEGRDHELELAIGTVPDLPSPAYYAVDPELGNTRVHWYLGLLMDLAPARILTVAATPGNLLEAIRHRPYGRSLPDLPELAARTRDFVPAGLSAPRGKPAAQPGPGSSFDARSGT